MDLNSGQLPYLMAINHIPWLKAKQIIDILDGFDGDMCAAWNNISCWSEFVPLSKKIMQEIFAVKATVQPDRLYEKFLACGCGVTCLGDADYPSLLAGIFDPPLLLFYHGHLPHDDDIGLALIGSRRASSYGQQVAEIFSRDLAAQGAIIVSGMARGIDSICHRGALHAGGRTIAVLGSGLDVIYPPENRGLYAEICASGAVISEFPLGTEALPLNFPRRNRIISGLSRGIVVIEANEKSGTLRTVNYALEQGRDVFAVPGSIISPTSRGTNRLIRDGAHMVLSAEDVWRQYSNEPLKNPARSTQNNQPNEQLTAEECRLLALLTTPHRVDELLDTGKLTLPIPELSALLTMLEIRGFLRQLPGKYYQTIVRQIKA